MEIQEDVQEVLGKLQSLLKANGSGHDVRDVVGGLVSVVSQAVAVFAVKHMEAMSSSGGDPDAVEAIADLADINDKIRAVVEKSTMSKAQKDEIIKLLDEADDIADDFLSDGEEEELWPCLRPSATCFLRNLSMVTEDPWSLPGQG